VAVSLFYVQKENLFTRINKGIKRSVCPYPAQLKTISVGKMNALYESMAIIVMGGAKKSVLTVKARLTLSLFCTKPTDPLTALSMTKRDIQAEWVKTVALYCINIRGCLNF
jgi:hypothetical protein